MKPRLPEARREAERRVYLLCSFEPGLVVPSVQLLDAATDDDAVACARASNLSNRKEVWDQHRLVAVVQPTRFEATGSSARGFAAAVAARRRAVAASGRRTGPAGLSGGLAAI